MDDGRLDGVAVKCMEGGRGGWVVGLVDESGGGGGVCLPGLL